MIDGLIAGRLIGDPERRVGKADSSYVVVRVHVARMPPFHRLLQSHSLANCAQRIQTGGQFAGGAIGRCEPVATTASQREVVFDRRNHCHDAKSPPSDNPQGACRMTGVLPEVAC